MNLRLATALLGTLAFACGGPVMFDGDTPDGGAGSPGATPAAIVIVAPQNHHEFEFEDEDDDHHGDDRFQIEVQVERAELAEPGQCRGRGGCGHLVLLIDGNACGNPNSSSSSHQFEGHFGKCLKVSGQHQIVVQLVDDAGKVLAASAPLVVNVTLKGRHGGAAAGGDGHGDDHGGDHGGDDHGGGGMGGDDGSGHH